MNPNMKNSKISASDDDDTTEIAMIALSLSFAVSIALSILYNRDLNRLSSY